MRRLALLAVLLAGRAVFAQTITVVAGTYGGNLGAPRGNVTWHLSAACNGQTTCNYAILAGYIGDPYPYQKKDYKAEWTCTGDPTVKTITTPPGVGSVGEVITLSCAPTPTPMPTPAVPVKTWVITYTCNPPQPSCVRDRWTLELTLQTIPGIDVTVAPKP